MEEKNSEKEVIENESKQDETKEKIQDESKTAKTENSENTENGIEISNDVIAVIAGVAVSEVQGVASMSGGFAGGITEVLSGKKNMAKGIKVDKTENTAKIDVNIIVEYGSRIPDVAFEIQNRVKKSVESMTGFKVEEVNVHVQGVDTNISKIENTDNQKETNENEGEKEKMKFIEKVTLIIYSNIILILSVIACLLVFGWIDIDVVQNLVKDLILYGTSSKIILGVSIVFILLSLRCIFFDPTSKQELKDKQGILLANDNGKLMISKETIEDLVQAVTKQYKMAKEVTSRVELDKENNVNIFVNLVVGSDTVIKDLSADLQDKIKTKVKETTDLEVKEVNITVKKAVQEKQPKTAM